MAQLEDELNFARDDAVEEEPNHQTEVEEESSSSYQTPNLGLFLGLQASSYSQAPQE